MATGDGAEVRVALSPAEDTVVGRQGETGPLQSGRESTLRFGVISGMVGCCVWGPVDRGKVPVGLCDRPYVADFEGPAPYLAIGAQVHQEAGGKQPGDYYQPGSCWEVHQPGSWWIRSWQSGRSLRAR